MLFGLKSTGSAAVTSQGACGLLQGFLNRRWQSGLFALACEPTCSGHQRRLFLQVVQVALLGGCMACGVCRFQRGDGLEHIDAWLTHIVGLKETQGAG